MGGVRGAQLELYVPTFQIAWHIHMIIIGYFLLLQPLDIK
jgi:hypothetical protein